MPLKPETRFKNKIRPKLDALPCTWVCKVQQTSLRGTPDFLLCVRGLFIALELKKSRKDKADPLQEHTLSKINASMGFGFVVSPETWPQIHDWLENLACKGIVKPLKLL